MGKVEFFCKTLCKQNNKSAQKDVNVFEKKRKSDAIGAGLGEAIFGPLSFLHKWGKSLA
jgi:hypothetical protein